MVYQNNTNCCGGNRLIKLKKSNGDTQLVSFSRIKKVYQTFMENHLHKQLLVVTNLGTLAVVIVDWRQGYSGNYFFIDQFTGREIDLDFSQYCIVEDF